MDSIICNIKVCVGGTTLFQIIIFYSSISNLEQIIARLKEIEYDVAFMKGSEEYVVESKSNLLLKCYTNLQEREAFKLGKCAVF